MGKNKVCDKLQWRILEQLFYVYPNYFSLEFFITEFGSPRDYIIIVNIRALVSLGLLVDKSLLKVECHTEVDVAKLRLTRNGLAMLNSILLDNF